MSRAPRRPLVELRGLLHPACGPLVRGVVARPPDPGESVGASPSAVGLFLVDTGASISGVDRRTAGDLRLPTYGAATWSAVTDAAHTAVAPLRRARLRLGDDRREWELDLLEIPDLRSRVAGYAILGLLGWDFLAECRLAIDGPSGTFTLGLPNG